MKINFKDKSTIALLVILGVVTAITVGIGIFYFVSEEAGIKVEDFVGKPVQDVMSWVDANKLTDEQIEYIYQYDEEIAEDTVVSQSLEAETVLKKKDKLSITVSKGADPDLLVALPDFTGMKKEEISSFFTENKFTDVTFEYIVDKEVEKDYFLKINVENEAKRSDMIIVTLSVGAENVGIDVTVPDFKDSTQANIKAWAETNNITVTFTTQSSDTIESGKVISQSPLAGETIQTGGKMSVVLSGGKGITLTSLSGKTKEEVEAWVKETGAKVSYISYYADSTAEGKVISTTPSSGTVSASTTIKVYLSLGSVKAADLVGKKEADVKTWLETINKSIYDKNNYITYKIVSDSSSDKAAGTILKTSPASSETIKLAGTITITVAAEKTVNVESKSNITVAELTSYLEGLGMKLGSKTSEVYSDTVASGKVVRNDSGTKTVGTSINYTLSLGKYSPAASQFENKTQSAVQTLLNTAKNQEAGNWVFTAGERVFSGNAKENTVSCSVDTSAKKVTCTISKGAGVTVKNYVGSAKPCSTDSCSLDDLTIKQVYESGYNANAAKDVVVGQSLASGTTVESGTTITLTLSRGPEPVVEKKTIPTLNEFSEGNTYEETVKYVTSTMNNAGFTNLKFVAVDAGSTHKVGSIASCSPAGGTEAAVDTLITIEIYK